MRINFKHLLPRTLFGRSLLIIVTPVLLFQIVAIFIFFDQHWTKMSNKLAFAFAGEVAVVVDLIDTDPNNYKIQPNISESVATKLDMKLTYLSDAKLPDERKLQGWRQNFIGKRIEKTLSQKIDNQFMVSIGQSEKWFNIYIQLQDDVLLVSVPEGRLFTSASYIFILWMVGLSLVLFAIAIIFMRNQIRPIRRLAVAADWFGRGRDFPSFKPEGAREVRQAALSFIGMRDRIKRQISQRTEMLAGVSHDLRTPLTRLKLQLAMQEGLPEIAQMEEDIKDMEKMIDGYLDFARGEGEEHSQKCNLKEELLVCVSDARRQDIEVAFEEKDQIQADIMVMLKVRSFKRVIDNIFVNAASHAQNIFLRIKHDTESKHVYIMVDDDGPGIEEAHRDDVFKPFYRLDPSRNIKTGGVGLGLSIAMDVVHAHGGQIWLEQSPEKGLRAVIRLPA